jgi:RHS repeat-associated protein
MEERFTYDWLNRLTGVIENGGPLGVFAVRDTRMQPAPKQMYYVHPDHLGSWTTVTGRNGKVVQDVWFDTLGTPYYSDSSHLVQAASLFFDRGFTGHEHMMQFDLINMNGRVYEPVTSTFLSVDNYVQDPSYTQNFNRYAYCLNNPLKYTDPDGEFFILDFLWMIIDRSINTKKTEK